MRMFGYYAWHCFVNSIRKLFKTWVLVFLLVCVAFGALIGIGAAMLEDSAGEDGTGTSETVPEEELPPEDEVSIEIPDEEIPHIVELAAGGVILAVFLFSAFGADKNGSKIFLPADVNLLFASPMQPQSVLMFRLMTQLGSLIAASVYFLFQLPNLLNLGMSIWAALALIAAWLLTILTAKLIQVLLYTVFSSRPAWKSYLRKGLYGLIALILVSFVLYQQTAGLGYYDAAKTFFNAPVSRFIPLWGWLKAFCVYAFEGNATGTALSFAAIVAGGVILVLIIRNVKADFYEDAMAKSQETAELLEQANKEGGVAIVKRKKDRSDRVWRDGLNHGRGANVFFFKALYNRFRFAHLHFFTKTTETYLFASVALSLLNLYVFEGDGLLICALVIAGLAFFRALGNPLEQDTQMSYFILIPDSAWKKLFWSLMGGAANCFLDTLPAILVAAVISGSNILVALGWIPLIVSVDLFSTTVGTFISLSVPTSAGKIVKQLVQIMFVYFGLLPDIAVIAVGFVMDAPTVGLVCAALLNIGFSAFFFFLTPLFIEPKDGRQYREHKAFAGDLGKAKQTFSRLGLGVFLILAVGSLAQLLTASVIQKVAPELTDNEWVFWIATMAPLYLIGVPSGLLVMRRLPKAAAAPEKPTVGNMICLVFVSIFMMYAGNIIGNIVSALVNVVFGIQVGNQIGEIAVASSVVPKLLFMVILAPIIEEFIFRKVLIDRMRVYGEKLAVVTSALIFGLFHGNLAQMFYAFTLGLVFGYVYLRTEKLRYSVGLHMLVNLLGSVVSVLVLEQIDLDLLNSMGPDTDPQVIMQALPGLLMFAGYALCMLMAAIVGLVVFCVKKRKIHFMEAPLELPKGKVFGTVFVNVGMILLVAACLGLVIVSLL